MGEKVTFRRSATFKLCRSEEHTSELQSQSNLVCRLLLEKKKNALRRRLKEYFADLVTPEEQEAMLTDRHGDVYRGLIRRIGADGWFQDSGDVERQILIND